MVDVRAFPCIRPREGLAQALAALPYDVFNLEEAKAEIEKNPLSFLRIDMAEATFEEAIDHNDDAVFAKSRALLDAAIAEGSYLVDEEAHYYLYRLCAPQGRCQTGVVGCASIDDYRAGTIKKHEKTRANKELNRIRHVDVCSAQTGPIFLAYRSDGAIEKVMERAYGSTPLYDFRADDGVRHTVWRVDDPADADIIRQTLARTPSLYIADGHHRAASAVKAGLLRRKVAKQAAERTGEPSRESLEMPAEIDATPDASWEVSPEEPQKMPLATAPEIPPDAPLASDHFLSVIFPADQLTILDYNRVVADLNGLSIEEFLAALHTHFEVSAPRKEQYKPDAKGSFGMYLEDAWYKLSIKAANTEDSYLPDDPVSRLDVTLLQDFLLDPVLGIEDPRTDARIDFIGGIRGLDELERRVHKDMKVAFALYPTSIEELFAVADADLLMPPKSTWFEPKLRSGIFIHRI